MPNKKENNLDINTLENLQSALEQFNGICEDLGDE